ncbi:MAG TPA: AAA family ATPase [Amoebophilaceae bacterium]|nr:AAA family ATPase [Amoebophilaceae bacterium]
MAAQTEDKGIDREQQIGMVRTDSYIPVGSPDVKEMITQNLYADKTAYIAKLFRTNGIYYFLIRPRRFGKSLLLDTIDQIAKGNKELFKTCAIHQDKSYNWKKYPVIWLNFSELSTKTSASLEASLIKKLHDIVDDYEIDKSKMQPIIGSPTVNDSLNDLIRALQQLGANYASQPIVLIDEYDSPLISCEKEQYEAVLSVLSSFFKVLKSRQKDCKFIFITGVTKFHLSGLTSGANSANDISLQEEYAAMLGYTEEDVEKLFFKDKQEAINQVITNLKENWDKEDSYTDQQLKQELKDYYNGYCFSKNKGIKRMYNPDSILKFFDEKKFGNYWFNRGNPAILIEQMRRNIDRFNIDWDTDNFIINQSSFEAVSGDLHTMPILPLMYQTGYLTLDPDGYTKDGSIDKKATDYYLRFPNQEVKAALKLILTDFIAQKQQEAGRACSTSMLASVRKEAWVAFLNVIRSDCLAKAGYRFLDKTERSFQGALYAFLNGAFHTTDDTHATAERDGGIGRADIVMEDQYDDKRTIYLFELKVDKPTSYALEQIYSKEYSTPYGTCHKKVLIGLQCDSVKRNITAATIEVHQKNDQEEFQLMPRKNFAVNAVGYFQESGDAAV